MRFLITPNLSAEYDARMVMGLATAIKNEGHEAEATASPLSEEEVTTRCRDFSVDILFQVNRSRPIALSPSVRHIAWYQDIFPSTLDTMADSIGARDIVYVLGDPVAMGLNIALPCPVYPLFTGVDEVLLRDASREPAQDLDFSLCGHIPTLLNAARWYTRPLINLGNKILDQCDINAKTTNIPLPIAVRTELFGIVERNYRPLRGELDINELTSTARAALAKYIATGYLRSDKPVPSRPWSEYRRRRSVESFIDYVTREYPRLLDRVTLVTKALHVSPSLELYGPGWETHERFRPYHKGVLSRQHDLLSIYERTRINLANNTHGLGLHSRTLECMAVGGFIFMHRSERDKRPGGMLTSFEPDLHYGMYTPENLEQEAQRWLRDDNSRLAAGRRARAVIKDRHLWRHRAQQILKDLAA